MFATSLLTAVLVHAASVAVDDATSECGPNLVQTAARTLRLARIIFFWPVGGIIWYNVYMMGMSMDVIECALCISLCCMLIKHLKSQSYDISWWFHSQRNVAHAWFWVPQLFPVVSASVGGMFCRFHGGSCVEAPNQENFEKRDTCTSIQQRYEWQVGSINVIGYVHQGLS